MLYHHISQYYLQEVEELAPFATLLLPLESGSKFKFPPKDTFRFDVSLSVEALTPTFVYLRRRVWGFPAIDFRSIAGESLRAPLTGGRGT